VTAVTWSALEDPGWVCTCGPVCVCDRVALTDVDDREPQPQAKPVLATSAWGCAWTCRHCGGPAEDGGDCGCTSHGPESEVVAVRGVRDPECPRCVVVCAGNEIITPEPAEVIPWADAEQHAEALRILRTIRDGEGISRETIGAIGRLLGRRP
jgi:hypothetical protein